MMAALLMMLAVPAHGASPDQRQPLREITLGSSTQGQPITALELGGGPRELWLIGSTHGEPERNTYELVIALGEYFQAHPEEIPDGVRLLIVPTINPDGLTIGTRFNARSVDLNRNMNTTYDRCTENDWNHEVQGAYGIISDTGGPHPESEVETLLVREMLLGASAVIFYHSDGGVVFPAECDAEGSRTLAQAYALAAGYEFWPRWQKYQITGGMHDWAGSLGIAAITPELRSATDPEFTQNLAAVKAVLRQYDQLLPLPESREVAEVTVEPLLWRYWRSHGGEATFGRPISPPVQEEGAIVQYFEQARLELVPPTTWPFYTVATSAGSVQRWADYLVESQAAAFQLR